MRPDAPLDRELTKTVLSRGPIVRTGAGRPLVALHGVACANDPEVHCFPTGGHNLQANQAELADALVAWSDELG